jgi:hypothetical protein
MKAIRRKFLQGFLALLAAPVFAQEPEKHSSPDNEAQDGESPEDEHSISINLTREDALEERLKDWVPGKTYHVTLWSGGVAVADWRTNNDTLGGRDLCNTFKDVNGKEIFLHGTISAVEE